MLQPQIPIEEAKRLAAFSGLRVQDMPAKERLDRIIRTTRRLSDIPVTLISLVNFFLRSTILGNDVFLLPGTESGMA